jgi:hypothetical protein
MENKMKKLMIVAAFGAAAVLTACGDDSSSNASGSSKTQLDGKAVVSCDVVRNIAGIESHSCHAIAADDAGVDAFLAKCGANNEFDKAVYTPGQGCTGALLACDTPAGGQVEYFYDDASAQVGCEMASPHAF